MKAYSTASGRDNGSASNRRQPVRQARTNPQRTSNVHHGATSAGAAPSEDNDPPTPGFYPAITHFTDSIAALPKEMVRHYTMLKEVDAKIYGPEAMLGQMFNSALKMAPQTHVYSQVNPEADNGATARRELFQNMRIVLNANLAILDEKNHVMNTAIDALDKQLKRCQSSLPYIDDEISEEARLGSTLHWAYTDKTSEKKGIIAGERTRRAANSVAAQEAEVAARSELRREAVAARKGRNQHVDSDFDDMRVAGRKGQAGAKGRKIVDTSFSTNGVGLGISNVNAPPNKRRKIEKNVPGSQPMERATGSAYGSNTGSGRGGAKNVAPFPAKKSKVSALANGTGKRRGNPGTSAANSPAASSPVMGTFTASSKERSARSPAPTSMQRVPSARARQSSLQNVNQSNKNRAGSVAQKNGTIGGAGTQQQASLEAEKPPVTTGRPIADGKAIHRESISAKGENASQEGNGKENPSDTRGAPPLVSRSNSERNTKKEEPEPTNGPKSRAERPPSISTRGGGSKQPSANPTPHATTFGEQAKPRATVKAADLPVKRSHKKGAGLAAQLAAAEAAREEEGSSAPDDDEDGENEPRYCYCNGVSYGEMVGCDADDCAREWFHLQCVGLSKAPAKNAKWYCDECKEKSKNKKVNGGNGR